MVVVVDLVVVDLVDLVGLVSVLADHVVPSRYFPKRY